MKYSIQQLFQSPSRARCHALIGLCAGTFVLVLDQLIKKVVQAELPFQQAVEVMPFFSLFYTFNTGVAFSFMSSLSPLTLLGIASLVVIIMLGLWWQARHDGLLAALGFGMISGGAIGNMIDRGLYGHVIDYVLLYWGAWSFAIFNLADAALTTGVLCILVSNFLPSLSAKQAD